MVKATQPFERIAVDFKGPLPRSKSSNNRFILTNVDEYSRFVWAFPWKDTSTSTAFKIYHELFGTFGTPNTIHLDRGSGFLPATMRKYFSDMGINMSATTPYHPQGNGQCERFNGTIWKTVRLLLHSHKMDMSNWETMLPTALHSIRSLLNTSTNCTPYESFFNYQRRLGSIRRKVLPSWLINPGPVLLKNFEKFSKNDDLVKRVELLEAKPHYALIKSQRGNIKTVSTQNMAPYSREVQNSRGEQMQDFDELVSDAANSKPRVLIPRLCLPNEILQSSESNNQDAKMDE